MSKVIAQAMMSLDGYIAKDDHSIGRLFDWLNNGDVEVVSPRGDRTFHVTERSAAHWRNWTSRFGVLVCGRALFDLTNGWDGRHDFDVPVVVVTHTVPEDWVAEHPDAPFHFVTTGVAAAIELAMRLGGDRAVNVTAGVVAGQCVELGLLDEVAIGLVPVVMGGGRPFFGHIAIDDYPLGNPTTCIVGDQVTHLVFPLKAVEGEGGGMRTLHFSLRVADRDRSLAFYEVLGYEIVGRVPDSPAGDLTMIKLPDDEFVTIELVHDPAHSSVGAETTLTCFVIAVESMANTVAALDERHVQAETPTSPDGRPDFLTSYIVDPDGNRIELVQWPAGHAVGMSAADWPGAPQDGSPR